MKSFDRWVDRFCASHRRFGIANLMLYIVIGNVIVWLFGMMDTTNMLYSMLYFDAEAIFRHGQVWRLVTFVLVPQYSGLSLLISLYFYYFIGSTLEQHWGTARFTLYYIFGMVFNMLYGVIFWLLGFNVSVDASYLNLSMFFAFAATYPDLVVLLFFIIPIKIKWLAWIDAAFFALSIVMNPFPVNLLPVVAVLNFLLFCGSDLMAYVRPYRNVSRGNTVNFRREVNRMKREERSKDYTRRCEVCGRTDRDYPDLEFRYCSRCTGYHCYCIDHINNHVHHKD
ncbi:MAG TPA: rhomboid family intramembrane serine protease [Firmicutes bacterium]|nr:rhomboid family intramembrane serine protease [Bacillota bacterium]